jgi:hypothetical protein
MTTNRPLACAAHVRRGNGLVLLVLLLVVVVVLVMMFGKTGGTSYMDQVKQTRDSGREMAREIPHRADVPAHRHVPRNQQAAPRTLPPDLESPGAFNDGWGKEMTFSFEEKAGKTMVKVSLRGPRRCRRQRR